MAGKMMSAIAITTAVIAVLACSPSLAGATTSACEVCRATASMGYCVEDGQCYSGDGRGAIAINAPTSCQNGVKGNWIWAGSTYSCPPCAGFNTSTSCLDACGTSYGGVCGYCTSDGVCYGGDVSGAFSQSAPASCRSGSVTSAWQMPGTSCFFKGDNLTIVIVSSCILGFGIFMLFFFCLMKARKGGSSGGKYKPRRSEHSASQLQEVPSTPTPNSV
mmetsp:Transcript_17486/g.43590  ORF Transcript_17486/g.43590 Transcript_17486/m.43590 type:complete len:218 (-) Transcript_17486:785-1438(-)|eukprot:CAMPEP_0113891190 /NCGR_PEP_ID=MMETSP0780_2-20120614/14605_1 /TAXON_ID=652834 /ORGANISM="Palpitomonas bilix" /LENGTH=217 /DNA_ID=CAMNT_0000880753 /DNA_START=252 /DNA_END=905 /DNA_ORIENTATION=- /assembly_acc=CAM_ASM_000599